MSNFRDKVKNLMNPHVSKIAPPPVNLNLKTGLEWLVHEANQLSNCENVIWLSEKEFRSLKKGAEGEEYASSLTYFEDVSMVCVTAISAEQLMSKVSHFDADRLTTSVYEDMVLTPICHSESHQILGYLLGVGIQQKFLKRTAQAFSTLASVSSRYIAYCIQYFEATTLSLKDDLTHLYNQKYLAMVLDNEVNRSKRDDLKFSVLFIDIDHFKKVNDKLGHWVGSHLLAELGGLIGSSIRKSDYAFRYGGDEFVIVLPSTDSEGGKITAERLREQVEQKAFFVDGEEVQITLSIGIATFPDHAKSRHEIIKMADEAMYNGKNKSRNIVLMAG